MILYLYLSAEQYMHDGEPAGEVPSLTEAWGGWEIWLGEPAGDAKPRNPRYVDTMRWAHRLRLSDLKAGQRFSETVLITFPAPL